MNTVTENFLRVKEEISEVCHKIGRNPQEVTLIGVTKFTPNEAIQEAIDAGLTDIAENKVQEGQKKYFGLKPGPTGVLRRHCIGHLQTNKAKDALKIFDLIQSVDSLKLALEIQKQSQKLNKPAEILIQINTAGEEQKFGAGKSAGLTLIEEIAKLSGLKILGLMTMAPFTDDEKIIRQTFKDLRDIRDEALVRFKGQSNVQMKFLSMGMSGDYRIALEEGSNMVRIGRAIFAAQASEETTHAQ